MSSATTHTDADADRCVQLELEDGTVLIYDVENPTAWLQTDTSVTCESVA